MPSSPLSTPISTTASMSSLSVSKKFLLLLGNAIPLLQVAGLVLLIKLLYHRPGWCTAAAVGWLYVAPPIVCRICRMAFPIRRESIPIGSRDFFAWWFQINLQMLFSRFAFLEELLRLIPSFYSGWLRLWGSKVGKLTYWGGGLLILDRQYLCVGDHVTFGAGVRINPHVIQPDADGRLTLYLAPVTVGHHVNVGGYSLLLAGSGIGPEQCTRAFLILPPFNRVEHGKRNKPDGDSQLPFE